MYGRFTLMIVKIKWPCTIGVKYLTSQAKILCPVKLDLCDKYNLQIN